MKKDGEKQEKTVVYSTELPIEDKTVVKMNEEERMLENELEDLRAIKSNLFYTKDVRWPFSGPELKLLNLLVSKVNSQFDEEGETYILYMADIKKATGIEYKHMIPILKRIKSNDILLKGSDEKVRWFSPIKTIILYNGDDDRIDGRGKRIGFQFHELFSKYILKVDGGNGGYTSLSPTHHPELQGNSIHLYDFCLRYYVHGGYKGKIDSIYDKLGFIEHPKSSRSFERTMNSNIKKINKDTEFDIKFSYKKKFGLPYYIEFEIEIDPEKAPKKVKSVSYTPICGDGKEEALNEKWQGERNEYIGGKK